jgi:ribosomal protein L6P/L9E
MSRIGKKAIDIPKDVSIKMENGNEYNPLVEE